MKPEPPRPVTALRDYNAVINYEIACAQAAAKQNAERDAA